MIDRRAVALAGHIGDAPTARAGLVAEDAVVRATALGALARLDLLDEPSLRAACGDEDAAVDPLSAPDIRAAVARATFELLIGFQLTQEQLQYNVTR